MAVDAYLDIVNHNIKEHSYENTEDNISKEERLDEAANEHKGHHNTAS